MRAHPWVRTVLRTRNYEEEDLPAHPCIPIDHAVRRTVDALDEPPGVVIEIVGGSSSGGSLLPAGSLSQYPTRMDLSG